MADTDDPSVIGDALRELMSQAPRALTLEVTAGLIERCPVKTGHARANFVPAVGSGHTGEDDGAAQAAGTIAVSAWRLGDGPLSISNNVPYIDRLIGGSSAQAPAGWDLEAIDTAAEEIRAHYEVDIDITAGVPGLVKPSVTITPRG